MAGASGLNIKIKKLDINVAIPNKVDVNVVISNKEEVKPNKEDVKPNKDKEEIKPKIIYSSKNLEKMKKILGKK